MWNLSEGLRETVRCPSASFAAGRGDWPSNPARLLYSDRGGAKPEDPTNLGVLRGTLPSSPCHGFVGLGLGSAWPRCPRRIRRLYRGNGSHPRRGRSIMARSPRGPRGRPRASALRVDICRVFEAPLTPQSP